MLTQLIIEYSATKLLFQHPDTTSHTFFSAIFGVIHPLHNYFAGTADDCDRNTASR